MTDWQHLVVLTMAFAAQVATRRLLSTAFLISVLRWFAEPPRMLVDPMAEVQEIAVEQARFGLLTHAAKSLLVCPVSCHAVYAGAHC